MPERSYRLELLDGIRGILMINAMLYHILWDLVYIYGIGPIWYRGTAGHIWQQCICCGFILLSGICRGFGKRPLGHFKRGLTVFLCGAAVTLVTMLFVPDSVVIFGILTFIGTCMLLLIPLDGLLARVDPLAGAAVSLFLFIVLKNVNYGTVFFGLIKMPQFLYSGYEMTFLGFMEQGFYSADYFSLLPWGFLYLTGYFLSPAIKAADSRLMAVKLPAAGFVGRHSLVFYLAHQPIFYFLLRLIIKN